MNQNLSDTIERKFIESFDIDDFEIMTDEGWRDCSAIHKTVEYRIWRLRTETHELECADTHIVFDENLNQRFVKDLRVGDSIMTETGTETVTSIEETSESDNMYDIELADDSNHRYYTNGILSHNTTTYTIYALWTLIFQPEKRIMLLANKADTMLEIIDRIRLAYGYLPTWMKPGVVTWNKGEITFSNKSAIKGFATSSDAARGYSAGIVIMDEAGFVPNNIASKVFESIYPVISSSKNSHFIMVSTPNGADPHNLYYSIWQKANQKSKDKNSEGWKAFRFDWWDVPGRDEQWKATTIASIGQRRFAQEFGNEFLSNATTKKLIDDDIVERYRMRLSEYKAKGFEPKVQRIVSENQNRIYEFKMWHAFDAKRTYLGSCDIAEGIGGDSSVLYVWDITDMRDVRMCAKFSSNRVSLTEFAYICSKILALYGSPFLFGERNGLSAGMIDALRITYGYENIAAESKNGEPGIYSHVSVKLKSCLWARDMLTTDGFGFTIYDKELLDEMGTFVKKDGKSEKTMYAAISPAHDDCIMSFVWACYACQPEICEKYFIVAENFKSVFDQIYPRTVLPMTAYTSETMKKIQADPLYRDFVDWKEEAVRKNKSLEEQFRKEDEKDVFKYSEDPYFGGAGEAEWGSSWDFRPIRQGDAPAMNPNNRMPAYFI